MRSRPRPIGFWVASLALALGAGAAGAALSTACLVTIPDLAPADAGAHEAGAEAGAGGGSADAGDAGPSCDAVDAGGSRSPWVPADYGLVFSDEFNESTLDTTRWWTRYSANGGMGDTIPSNDELEVYRDANNHVMTGSSLRLTAYHEPGDPSGFNYLSGMIRSKMLVRYGYLEARVRVPKGRGVWPAFWLFPETGPAPPFVVIFSYVDNGITDTGNKIHIETHVDNTGVQGGTYLQHDPSFDVGAMTWTAPYEFADCFHVMGLLWEPDEVTVSVDGKPIVQVAYQWVINDAGALGDRAEILLDLAIGGSSGTVLAGAGGVDDSKFPQAFEVDYVRVYQKTPDYAPSTAGVDTCTDGGC